MDKLKAIGGWLLLLIPIVRAILQALGKTDYLPILDNIGNLLGDGGVNVATAAAVATGGALLHSATPPASKYY